MFPRDMGDGVPGKVQATSKLGRVQRDATLLRMTGTYHGDTHRQPRGRERTIRSASSARVAMMSPVRNSTMVLVCT